MVGQRAEVSAGLSADGGPPGGASEDDVPERNTSDAFRCVGCGANIGRRGYCWQCRNEDGGEG